jgi:putative tryptophan/tyrosine transport system substrate-binding protein
VRRRKVITGLALLLPGWCFGARGQTTRTLPLIAWLAAGSKPASADFERAFREGFEELGYQEGRDYRLEIRHANGVLTHLPTLAEELVRLKPDVILAASTPSAVAAQKATSEIPIIAPSLFDAVDLGLIGSHAHPGSNVTGIVVSLEELAGKQLALAHELMLGPGKIGLFGGGIVTAATQRRGAHSAAAALSVQIVNAEVQSPADFDNAFQLLARAGVAIVLVLGDASLLSERQGVAAAALSARLPSVYTFREHVEAGGLMSYGVNLRESSRRAASFVSKILKGAKPADLPVEVPTKFELVINLKTANELGLTIPPTLLARADEVIE